MLRAVSYACAALLVASGSFVAAPALAAPDIAPTLPECAPVATLEQRLAGIQAHSDRPASQPPMDANRAGETRFVLGYVKPGDGVLDFGAGSGYATMLLSAAVCTGTVDSQNPKDWDVNFKLLPARQALAAARPNIHLVDYDFDHVPSDAGPFDAIFIGTVYHDTYNMPGHDALTMNKSLFNVLKPGGVVILTDHNTAAGIGSSQTNSLHRIDKATVIADFKAAGFELLEDSTTLANPDDDHSKNVFDPSIRGHTDRMALVFKRP